MALKKSELYSSLWQSCDELRGSMDASQYKDYVLVLLFIKYVSDKYAGVPYAPITIPDGASFKDMVALKGKSDIGDQIMKKIIGPLSAANKLSEMPDFNSVDKLGSGKELVERLTNLIAIFENPALDFSKNRADGDDILGDAYEYLMRHFATESGKSKGQFYTPAEVSRIMAKIIGIHSASTCATTTVYDPTCGSGSLLLKVGDEARTTVTLYGQEKDSATAALARMNMVLHNNPTALIEQGNTLTDPKFREAGTIKTFDYVVANPPFSDKRWSTGLDPLDDPYDRFKSFGIPPAKQGDYAYPNVTPGSNSGITVNGGNAPAPTSVALSNCSFYSQESSVASYDYGAPGSNTIGPLVTTEVTNYLWQNSSRYLNANMLGLVQSQQDTDSSGNWAAEIYYCYDAGASVAYGNQTSAQKFAQKPATRTCTNPTSTSSAPLTKTAYNSQGIVTSKTDADGNVTTFNSFACNGSLPVSVTLASGYSVTYQYDCNTGKPTAFQDQNDINNSKSITYTYNDPLSRLTNIIEPDGGGIQVAYALGTTLPITMQVTTTTGETAGPSVTTSTFDGLARKIQTKQQESQSSFIYTTTNYDNMGRVASQSNPYRSTGDSIYGFTTFTYDPLGRKVFEVAPDGTSTKQWCYNGLATNGQSNCNNRLGDQNGTWTDSADENNNDWQHISDAEGRLLSAIEPNGTSQTPSLVTDYAYDVLGNLQCAEQLGSGGGSFTVCSSAPTTWRPRSFTYNALSQLLTAYNPESGSLQYTYDANGNVQTKTDARNVRVSYAYDKMNRLLYKNYSTNDPSACMQYDTPLSGVTDSNPIGHMTAEWTVPKGKCPAAGTKITSIPSTAYNSTIITSHDSLGRELGNWQCPSGSNCGSTYAFNYQYDLAGNLTQFNNGMPLASSSPVSPYLNFQIVYDSLSRVSQLANIAQPWVSNDDEHPLTLLNNPVYDAMGHMTGAQISTLPSTQSPSIAITRQYDKRGRITNETDNGTISSPTDNMYQIAISGNETGPINIPGTSGSTVITITGTEGTHVVCQNGDTGYQCHNVPDTGTLSITVNSSTSCPVSVGYGSTSTDASIASAFAAGFNNACPTIIKASSPSSGVLLLTAVATGPTSNYTFTITNGADFTLSDSSTVFIGGANGSTAYDAGTITATITTPSGTTYTTSPISWGQNSTPSTIATALASAIQIATETTPGNANTNLIKATANGSTGTISLSNLLTTANYTVSVNISDTERSQYPKQFPTASFDAVAIPMNSNGSSELSTPVYSYSVPPSTSTTGYAPNGNLLSYQDSIKGNWSFSYDTLNRLTTGTAASGLYSGQTGCWSYDIFGNRTQQSFQANNTSCTTTPTTSYNALNQLTSINQTTPEVNTAGTALMAISSNSSSFSYDASGDTTADAANQYAYDAEGRLCAVYSSATSSYTGYLYDASGTRTAKGNIASLSCNLASNGFTPTTLYLLGKGSQVTELNVSGGSSSWAHSNIWLNGSLTGTYDLKGLHFHLADPLGTRRVQLSTAGAIEESCYSLPFGDGLSCVKSGLSTVDDATEHHFTGKEHDAESGNDYFVARYYESILGRLMSPDPGNIGADLTNPQTLSMYSYGLNNPFVFTDPTGMYVCEDSWDCDSANDKHFANALSDARIYAMTQLHGQDRQDALNSINAYGDTGVDNGVNVRFDSNITDGISGAHVDGMTEVDGVPHTKTDDNANGQSINVTFNPDALAPQDAPEFGRPEGLVAHEGSHVADASAWVTSNFSVRMNITRRETEFRAHKVQFNIIQASSAFHSYGYQATFTNQGIPFNQTTTFQMIMPDLVNKVILDYGGDKSFYQGSTPTK